VAFFNFGEMTVEEKQTFITHLEELRRAILISVIAIVIGAGISFYYNEAILSIIVAPLSALQQSLIVTGVTEAFFGMGSVAFCQTGLVSSRTPLCLYTAASYGIVVCQRGFICLFWHIAPGVEFLHLYCRGKSGYLIQG
jgi:Sec-independent protein secretion pathway component TatC